MTPPLPSAVCARCGLPEFALVHEPEFRDVKGTRYSGHAFVASTGAAPRPETATAECERCGHFHLSIRGKCGHIVGDPMEGAGAFCDCPDASSPSRADARAIPGGEDGAPPREPNPDDEFLRNVAGHFWRMDAECTSILGKGVSAIQAARLERIAARLSSLTAAAKRGERIEAAVRAEHAAIDAYNASGKQEDWDVVIATRAALRAALTEIPE